MQEKLGILSPSSHRQFASGVGFASDFLDTRCHTRSQYQGRQKRTASGNGSTHRLCHGIGYSSLGEPCLARLRVQVGLVSRRLSHRWFQAAICEGQEMNWRIKLTSAIRRK